MYDYIKFKVTFLFWNYQELVIYSATIRSRNCTFVNVLRFHIVSDPVIKVVSSQFYPYWRVFKIDFFGWTFPNSSKTFRQNISRFKRSVVALMEFSIAQTVLAQQFPFWQLRVGGYGVTEIDFVLNIKCVLKCPTNLLEVSNLRRLGGNLNSLSPAISTSRCSNVLLGWAVWENRCSSSLYRPGKGYVTFWG